MRSYLNGTELTRLLACRTWIALIFEGTIADIARSIEENRSCEGVAGFTFVEADLDPSAQRWILKPI
jgi:hypothetical protein